MWDFNNTKTEYPLDKTIHQLFEEQAKRTPDNTALVFDDGSMTYRELCQRSNQLAGLLIDKGIKANDNVAIIMERGFDMVIGMYAILKAGAAYVPIDPDYPLARKKYIIQNSNAAAVLADGDYGLDEVINIKTSDSSTYSKLNPLVKKDSKELAYIIYTSGSTGLPKGVMIEHHCAVNLISWVNKRFNVNENDSLLFITSMCFDLSVYDIFGILASGGRVVIVRKQQVQNPLELRRLLADEKITFWDSVPTTMNYLANVLEEADSDFRQGELRLVFLSGDWIPVKLPHKIRRFFPDANVISLGGATEGTVWSNYYPIEKVDGHWNSIPYGKPLDNNYFYILDDNLNPVPDGETGELFIGGVGVARGYINDLERTKNSFLKNIFHHSEMMYRTGDLGRVMPDGNMEFLGRKDHQVKIRGFRVETGEVENAIQKREGLRDCVVTDRTDNLGNKYLCAYIVAKDKVDITGLKKSLQNILPDYMVPSVFVELDELPLNQNGKIDRKALPEPCMAAISTGVEYIPPSNKIEQKLKDVWEKVLGIKNIGIDYNFFDIGGSSVLAVMLEAEAEKENMPLKLGEIAVYTTIRGQGAHILGKQIPLEISAKKETPDVDIEDSKVVEPIEPFTDVFYKNCLYNSLFPVINHFGKDIKTFLVNDAGAYVYNENWCGIRLSVEYISEKSYQELLDMMGIIAQAKHVGNDVINSITDSISKGNPVILWIDSFYEPFRMDTYKRQHWPHTLLIYGHNQNSRIFNIIEHNHRDDLVYKRRTITYEDIIECHNGYLHNFYQNDTSPVYLELSSCSKLNVDIDYKQILFENMQKWRNRIIEGLESILKFKIDYMGIIEAGETALSSYVKEMISIFNKIIDNRKVERYKISKVLGQENTMVDLLSRIIGQWDEIRSDLIKFSVNFRFKEDAFKAHAQKLQEIYETEKNYQQTINTIIPIDLSFRNC